MVHEDEGVEFIGYDYVKAILTSSNTEWFRIKRWSLSSSVRLKRHFMQKSGGQVGDSGWLISESEKIRVVDTKKENDLIVHFVEKLPQHPEKQFSAEVDQVKRTLTMNNHTATHLLQSALKSVLGDHIQQRGFIGKWALATVWFFSLRKNDWWGNRTGWKTW